MYPNRYRTDADKGVAYLLLRAGREVCIDLADLERSKEGHWYLTRDGGLPSVRGNVAGVIVLLHHHLLGVARGTRVRHLNGNRLDCRRVNLDVLPERPPRQSRVSSSGVRNVYHTQRNGRWIYMVNIVRGGRQRNATFPDTTEGLERARRQAAAWRKDIDAAPLFPPRGTARIRHQPGALGVVGLSIWRDPRTTKRYYRFSCQRPMCRDWRCFPYTPEGLIAAQTYAKNHYPASNEAPKQDVLPATPVIVV